MTKRILLLILLLLWSNNSFAYDWTQDANCIGAWLLEIDETPQTDSSTNSNTLIVNNATYTTTSPPKTYSTAYYSLVEASSSSLYKVGASSDFEMTGGTSAFSFTSWANWDNFTGTEFNNTIMMHDDNSSGDGWGLSIGNAGSEDITLFTTGGNSGEVAITVSTGTWYHIAAIFDQANTTIEIWHDGVRIHQDTSYADTSAITAGDADLTFGAVAGANRMDGDLDELAYFNDVLDSTDTNDIMDNGLQQDEGATRRIMLISKAKEHPWDEEYARSN